VEAAGAVRGVELGQEAAIAAGVGFLPLRTHASSAEMELAYSEVIWLEARSESGAISP
jgi:hypothetical protein